MEHNEKPKPGSDEERDAVLDALLAGDDEAYKNAGGTFERHVGGHDPLTERAISDKEAMISGLDAMRGEPLEFISRPLDYFIAVAKDAVQRDPKNANTRKVLEVYEELIFLGYNTSAEVIKALESDHLERRLIHKIITVGDQKLAVDSFIFKAATQVLKKDK